MKTSTQLYMPNCFPGGVIVGAVVQRNGFLSELGIVLPGQNYYYEDYGNYYDDRYN